MKYVLVVLCAACGGGTSPEAPCPVDVPDGDATVHSAIGREVVFHDSHGAVLSRAVMDTTHVAVGRVTACGAITVTFDLGMLTVMHVQPGETIEIPPMFDFDKGTTRELQIDFPLVAGAEFYEFRPGSIKRGCGCDEAQVTSSPAKLFVNDCCVAPDDTTAITALARGPTLFMYSSLEHVAVPDGVANRATVRQWTSDQDTMRVAATDAPTGSRPQFNVVQLAGPVAMDPAANTVIDTAGEMLLNRLGDRAAVRGSFGEIVVAGELTVADTVLRVVPIPVPASVEFSSADFAPRITSVTFDNDDPGRPSIVWTTARPTDGQTAVVAFAGIAFGGSWDIVAPPNQPGALRYPDLPPDLRPTTTGFGILWNIQSGEFARYADAHRQPTELTIPPFVETHADASGVTYRASLARTGPP